MTSMEALKVTVQGRPCVQAEDVQVEAWRSHLYARLKSHPLFEAMRKHRQNSNLYKRWRMVTQAFIETRRNNLHLSSNDVYVGCIAHSRVENAAAEMCG